jgi:DNA-directed RNA polymerase sigma subunit (sigma70/sigma32)
MFFVQKILVNELDKVQELRQECLFLVFSKSRHLLNDCVLLLESVSTFYQNKIKDMGSRITGEMISKQSIYKKSSSVIEGEDIVKLDKDSCRIRFMHSTMDLEAAMLKGDLWKQQNVSISLNLIRKVTEEILEGFLKLTGDYVEMSDKLVELRAANKSKKTRRIYKSQLAHIERKLQCTKPELLYGAVKYVRERYAAVKKLYSRVLEAYTRVTLKMAKASAGSEAQENDSFQNGCFGLMRAISSYDHCSYVPFVNFARSWIFQAVTAGIKAEANTISVGTDWQKYQTLEKDRVIMEAKYGPLSHEQFADKIGKSHEYVQEAYNVAFAVSPKSVDMPKAYRGDADHGYDPTIFNSLLDHSEEHLQEVAGRERISVDVMRKLSYNERLIVALYYGFTELVPPKPGVSDDQLREAILREKQRQVSS